jgi:hypothetical protein
VPPNYLPVFDFAATVSAATAKQDKMEIALRHGVIFDAADVSHFLHHLGPPPAHSANVPGDVYGKIFIGQQGQPPSFRKQPVRKIPTPNQPHSPPLFGGSLRIHALPGPVDAWRLWSLLTLNPTRFLRHQQLPALRSLGQESPPFSYSIYKGDITLDDRGEFPYIENDNWLSGRRFWSQYTAPRFWPRHLKYYLRKSIATVRADLNRAAIHSQVHLASEVGNPISLWSIEHYWEFASEESIETVKALKPMLDTYAAAPVETNPRVVQVSPGVEENSFCLKFTLRGAETVKIYAKTNCRIRIEVKHSLATVPPFRLPTGMGYTFSSTQAMTPLLSHLANCAAERVNHVLNHFRLHASLPSGQRTVLGFIADVQAACKDTNKASEILRLLTSNGSLVVGRGIPIGILFRNELRRLVRLRILKSSNRKYSVMPAYRQALLYLQERGAGRLLSTRIRRRSNG